MIGVGKAVDGLEFALLLDDGSEERALVFGVVAGLRAARHDLALVLPVDCPLLTPDALRALAQAGAVPQTGPLPGACLGVALPEFQSRVARGELSLRGVNADVLELDEALLLNVNTRSDLLVAAVADWARATDDVRAVVVVGSYARREARADCWLDVDVLLFVDDPRSYADDADWVTHFGIPVLTFLEPTSVGDRVERRVLYEDGVDVDFRCWRRPRCRACAAPVGTVLSRGYLVLHDEIGVGDALADAAAHEPQGLPGPGRVHAARERLLAPRPVGGEEAPPRRGLHRDLMPRRVYMKWRLLVLLEWHKLRRRPIGRHVAQRPLPRALGRRRGVGRPRARLRPLQRPRRGPALWETLDLFQGLELETARRLGLAVALDHADLRRRIAEVVPDPRSVSTLSP